MLNFKKVKFFGFFFQILRYNFFFIYQFFKARGGGEIWVIVTSFLGGDIELKTIKDMGVGGIKNKPRESGDVLYGRPQRELLCL